MASNAAQRFAIYEDLFQLPKDIRAEIVNGDIVGMPSALPEHGRIAGGVGRFLGGPFDYDDEGGPGGWWILLDVDIEFDRFNIRRPDVSGWRRERLPAPWGQRPIHVVPDWICEVLSPSNAGYDRVEKANLYAKYGVKYYWMIDPAEYVLEAYRLEGERWLRLGAWGEKDMARIEPFDAIELTIGKLFPPRPAPMKEAIK